MAGCKCTFVVYLTSSPAVDPGRRTAGPGLGTRDGEDGDWMENRSAGFTVQFFTVVHLASHLALWCIQCTARRIGGTGTRVCIKAWADGSGRLGVRPDAKEASCQQYSTYCTVFVKNTSLYFICIAAWSHQYTAIFPRLREGSTGMVGSVWAKTLLGRYTVMRGTRRA